MPIWEPLGSGRVYSTKFLERINWKLFNVYAKRRLDTHGFLKILGNQELVVYLNNNYFHNFDNPEYPYYYCTEKNETILNLKIINFIYEDCNIISLKTSKTESMNSIETILLNKNNNLDIKKVS